MAYSTQRVVSDGSLVLLSVSIGYLERSHIHVFFDNVENALPWAWVGPTDNQISFSHAVPNGVEVLVARKTDLSAPYHVFTQGAQFTAESLDEDIEQILYIAQEATEQALSGDFYQNVNMHNSRIINVADAVDPQDVMTLGQAQETMQPYVDAATASALAASNRAAAAGISEANASASEVAAGISAANAASDVDAAAASALAASNRAAAAGISEANALASEVAAGISAANAASEAQETIQPYVDAAAASALAASNMAAAAGISEANASASEVAAGISAANAASDVDAAAASALAASNRAAAAGISEANALASEVAAGISAANAASATITQVNAGATNAVLKTSGTGSMKVPAGTTAERDVAPVYGAQRANTTMNIQEWWNGSAWVAMGGGATGAPGNSVFVENDTNVTGNYTITTGKNAMSAGPITINNGVTVTVPDGSVWSIV